MGTHLAGVTDGAGSLLKAASWLGVQVFGLQGSYYKGYYKACYKGYYKGYYKAQQGSIGFRVYGFSGLGFRVEGFGGLFWGFWVWGLWGFRASCSFGV